MRIALKLFFFHTMVLPVLVMSIGNLFADDQNSSNADCMDLRSPDGNIEIMVVAKGTLSYAVNLGKQPLIRTSKLGLQFRDGSTLGKDVELIKVERGSVDSTWDNRWGKRSRVRDQHNELHLFLREKAEPIRTFEVIFRAFNDGIGFRYVLPEQAGMENFVLTQDLSEFSFLDNHKCYAGQQDAGFRGSQEWEFKLGRLADFNAKSIIGLPLLVQTSGAWVAITESDLRDWAGMWLAVNQRMTSRRV